MERKAVIGRKGAWLLGFAAFTVNALLQFSYRYLEDLANGRHNTFAQRMIDEMSGGYAVAVLFVGVVWVTRRFPLRGCRWHRAVPAHLAAMIVFCFAHTTMMWGSRSVLYPLFGLGRYNYGNMWYRYPMEGGHQVLAYWSFVAIVYFFDYYRQARDREVMGAELQARLAEAQLENLRLQLQPHFLFNALNTISSVMYEDPGRADTMLAQLSDLLRRTLRPTGSEQIPLAEELSLLKLYLNIMQARFGDGLKVEFSVEPAASEALVPQLILQPLVENSIRHGTDARSSRLDIRVGARRDDGMLLLEVRDRGPGITGTLRKGVGLTNTEERLEGLYGPAHGLVFENAAEGGLVVRLRIPFRTAAAAHA